MAVSRPRCSPYPAVPVIQIVVESYESLPIYPTFSEAQCLCICYLWTESEVDAEQRVALMEAMLDLNISVPLSSFGRIGEHYVLFGSLAGDSRINDIANDVVALLKRRRRFGHDVQLLELNSKETCHGIVFNKMLTLVRGAPAK